MLDLKKLKYILFSLLFLTNFLNAQTLVFYVDDDIGNDGFPGSYTLPFLTIEKAANAMATNVTFASCYIYPGTYNEQVCIFSNRNSGYMVFTALSNKQPVLTGSSTTNHGFYITNTSRIIIESLTITKFSQGVFINVSTNNYIKQNIIFSNRGHGIYVLGGVKNHMQYNKIRHNDFMGMRISWNSLSNYITHNSLLSNGDSGIELYGDSSRGSHVLTNHIYDQARGIRFIDSDFNIIRSNYIHHVVLDGISMDGSAEYNDINNNILYSNEDSGVGIYHDNVEHNYISNNTIWGVSDGGGILLQDGDNNIIKSNLIFHNTNGIVLYGGARSNICMNNVIYENRDDGIRLSVDDTENNSIINNTICGPLQKMGINISSGDNNIIKYNTIFNHINVGIYIQGSASNNYIMKNSCYSNNTSGIHAAGSAEKNYILTNYIWGTNQNTGIYFYNSYYNLIISNHVYHNKDTGINVSGSSSNNYFINNFISSNNYEGIGFVENSKNNYVLSNRIGGKNQDYGIYLYSGNGQKVYRNLIYNIENYCIRIRECTNIKIINNTIFHSLNNHGVSWENTSSGTMFNNIILSNGNGDDYGLSRTSTGVVHVAFNNFFGNNNGPTNGGFIWGSGNIFSDPLLDINTLIIALSNSPAVDSATNIPGVSDFIKGLGPDMGWKESPFTGPYGGPYYVDNDIGSNTYPGTFSQPFRTIQKAAEKMSMGVTISSCYIYPGIYSNQVSISSNKNSGFMVFASISNSNYAVMKGVSQNYGFYITNASRIIIQDLYIAKYSNGIALAGSSTNNFIIKNTIFSNSLYGVYIKSDSADKNYILTNDIQNNQSGVYLRDGDNNIIQINNIYDNSNGIYLFGTAMNNLILLNNIYTNALAGININSDDADFNYLYGNRIINNSGGILFSDGDFNVIRSNTFSSNRYNGIHFLGTVENNGIMKNEFYKNNQNSIWVDSFAAVNNQFETNHFSYNNFGLRISDGKRNIARSNYIHNNNYYGIRVTGLATTNFITKNMIWSNDFQGILMNGAEADNNYISSNIIGGINQNNGIVIEDATHCKIYRNLIASQNSNGIVLSQTASNIRIINNTILKCINGHGLLWNTTTSGTMLNNIILSNGDYGILSSSSGSVHYAYNCISGNNSGPTNGNLIDGGANLYQDPLIDTLYSFSIMASNSPAIDSGTNVPGITEGFQGTAPDMGWREGVYDILAPFVFPDRDGGQYLGDLSVVFQAYKDASKILADPAATIYVTVYRNETLEQERSGTGNLTLELLQGSGYRISYYAKDLNNNTSSLQEVEYILLYSSPEDIAVYPTIVHMDQEIDMAFIYGERKENVDIHIYTLRGDKVKTITGVDFRSGEYRYDTEELSSLPSGQYIVKIGDKSTLFFILKK
ncbi:MAG: right-handed parallel beta-helix repeat-containing protein [Spirochaetes bacterium]|nr:right-handed parallel beta-helix repeat-containing protein [Spirochaetota bacterium]